MAYINLDFDYFDHPKTKRLIGKLGVGAESLPLKLWCYCAKYSKEQGLLENMNAEGIRAICNWQGDAETMLLALLETCCIEATDMPNFYKVHEWEEHQGHIIAFHLKAKACAKKRWDKYRKDASSIASSNNVAMLSDCSIPNHTIPNHTNKINTYAEQVQLIFDYFCLILKKKYQLSPERKKIIEQRLKEGRTVEEMKLAIDNFSRDTWEDRHKFIDIVYAIGTIKKVNNLDKWLNQEGKKQWDI